MYMYDQKKKKKKEEPVREGGSFQIRQQNKQKKKTIHTGHIFFFPNSPNMSISDEYESLEVIGKGSFGTVRRVRHKDGQILVRKEIEYTSMTSQERNHIISELRILRELDHPHIVKYYRHDHIPEKKMIHIYMEYCEGGDLARVIKNFKGSKSRIPEEFVWQVLVQVLLGLYRCHYGINAEKVDLFKTAQEPKYTNTIIHRDIKPDNIFVGTCIKLGDFGLAKMLSGNDFAKTYVGTPYYMSPEVLLDDPYSPVCDIWSLGCVLYELCTLEPPFKAKSHLQLQAKIKRGVIEDVPDCYSSQLRTLIRSCITVDPEERPTCFDLINSLAVRFLRKEMELKEMEENLEEYKKQLLKRSKELKETSRELDEYKQELTKRERFLDEEFEMRKQAIEMESKEIRMEYQREFNMVVEQEVRRRMERKPHGPRALEEVNPRSPLKERNKPRVTDALERLHLEKRHTPEFEYVSKYR
ncbi:serine/threonine-protein kinase, putative [Candida dubliniensis CD36]|uniref:non-specific serine/threonine protein kinase n=1 Tax=Candida dubliniensis (strain CD36 / ATCC MYA-646 / CBS 7987 / NCPF 3949 / NRRL Y-17841) TaxID=573826 RepID=B9WM30_CANDC|nr:serine/threonine-protein kinase, putative [Candida dubliniensis CD36]CAX40143.1 serine/threonine-protein kinase, putative [Candida dubliniensis CD36]